MAFEHLHPAQSLSRPHGIHSQAQVFAAPPRPLQSPPGVLLQAASGVRAEYSANGQTSDVLEVRKSKRGGLGVFATRPISKFTRVVADIPMLMMRVGEDLPDLREAYERLSVQHRKLYDSFATNVNIERDNALAEKLRERGYPDKDVEDLVRTASTFLSNAFRVHDAAGNELRVLFPQVARFNHDCGPNCHDVFVQDITKGVGRMRVTTLRDIAAGEELTIAYFNLLQARADRQTRAQSWGFSCRCSVCGEGPDHQTAEQVELEQRRARIRELESLHRQYIDSDQRRHRPAIEAAILYAEEMVQICREDPALTPQLPNALQSAGSLRLPLLDTKLEPPLSEREATGVAATLAVNLTAALEITIQMEGADASRAQKRANDLRLNVSIARRFRPSLNEMVGLDTQEKNRS